jgi:hypothetical protein
MTGKEDSLLGMQKSSVLTARAPLARWDVRLLGEATLRGSPVAPGPLLIYSWTYSFCGQNSYGGICFYSCQLGSCLLEGFFGILNSQGVFQHEE